MIAATARALALLAALAAPPAAAQDSRRNLEDFDRLWQAVERDYAYFDGRRGAWRAARAAWRPRAASAATREDLVTVLEGLMSALRDDHAALVDRTPRSPRRVPGESDLWAEWRKDAAVIAAVRTFGDADVSGLRPGDVVVSIDGVPAERAVRARLGKDPGGPGARDWALRQALAGPREGTLRLALAGAGGPREVEIERRDAHPAHGGPLLSRRIGIGRDLGYLRLKGSLDDERIAADFDAALDSLQGTRALVLDLRDLSGGAAHRTTLAILGRFALAPRPWQKRRARDDREAIDTVAPRGAPYREPVLVLVDRWTAGEGEALAAGLAAVAGARLVGTAMAGLRGELDEVRLPHSGIVARFPARRTFTPDGRPRERLRPDVPVDLAAPQAGPGDPILYQALKLLEK